MYETSIDAYGDVWQRDPEAKSWVRTTHSAAITAKLLAAKAERDQTAVSK